MNTSTASRAGSVTGVVSNISVNPVVEKDTEVTFEAVVDGAPALGLRDLGRKTTTHEAPVVGLGCLRGIFDDLRFIARSQ